MVSSAGDATKQARESSEFNYLFVLFICSIRQVYMIVIVLVAVALLVSDSPVSPSGARWKRPAVSAVGSSAAAIALVGKFAIIQLNQAMCASFDRVMASAFAAPLSNGIS